MNSNKNQKTKKTAGLVISGVAVLAFSNIVVKIIGLLFKVPMHSILGDMGMGYFNAAYEVYKWFYTLSTAGLPIAVSVFVAESRAKRRYNQTKKILRVTLLLFIIVGITGTAVMIVFASLFAGIAGSPHAAPAIICLAPTLFFICVASAYRGYFQGHQYMTPTAVSQIIETAGKLIIGIVFAKFAYAKYVSPLLITFGSFDKIPEAEQAMSLSMVAAYAIVGLTIGVAAGTVYLWVTKLLFK